MMNSLTASPPPERRAVINELEGGFPHSDISGSKGACTSPELIAACHVLHRLYLPRHSSNALLTLDRQQTHARRTARPLGKKDQT